MGRPRLCLSRSAASLHSGGWFGQCGGNRRRRGSRWCSPADATRERSRPPPTRAATPARCLPRRPPWVMLRHAREARVAVDRPAPSGAPLGTAGAGGSATGGARRAPPAKPRSARPWTRSGPARRLRIPAPPACAQRSAFPAARCRRAFIFPPPDAAVAGQFTRCASFDVGAAKSVAVSPDGRLVALVDRRTASRAWSRSRSQQVFAVLASPRAMIDFVAYEPHGRGVLTLARGAARGDAVARVGLDAGLARDAAGTAVLPLRSAAASRSRPTASPPSFPRAPTCSCSTSPPGAVRARRRTPGRRPRRRLRLGRPAASSSRSRRWPRIASTTRTAARSRSSTPRRWPRSRRWPISAITAIPAAGGACRRSAHRRPTISCWSRRRVDDAAGRCARSGSATAGALPAPGVTAMPPRSCPTAAACWSTDGGALERVRPRRRLGHVGHDAGRSRARWPCRRTAACSRSAAAVARCCACWTRRRRRARDCLRRGPERHRPAPGLVPSPRLGASSLSSDGQLLALAAAHGEVRVVRRGDGAVVTRIPDGLADADPRR